jgi:hypothetical protein
MRITIQKLQFAILTILSLGMWVVAAPISVHAASSHTEFACQNSATNISITTDAKNHQAVVTCPGSNVIYLNTSGLSTVAVDATCSGPTESIGTAVDKPNAPTSKYIFYCVITSGSGDNSKSIRTTTTPKVVKAAALNQLCSDGVTHPKNNDLTNCPVSSTDPAATGGGNCADVNTCDLVTKFIKPFVNFLIALVGIAVVISIIIGGIQYGSSAGDPQKVTAAKNRIRNAVVALVTFLFLYALLNFLIPGGLV